MMEDGDILEDDPGDVNEPQNDQPDVPDFQPDLIEDGVEEAQLDDGGFGVFTQENPQKNLRDMFAQSRSRQFYAAGGDNQQINLGQFAVKKTVDVKRLKHQLWYHMEDKFD